ncbi:hypothetical protein EYZ11_009350 [Aspergillus tanneri]|nr:hypothetical protein EYZ11_009350 [Aspergillus tanneri]
MHAATLEEIAENGPDAFYSGRIANSIITAATATGSNKALQKRRDYNYLIQNTSDI